LNRIGDLPASWAEQPRLVGFALDSRKHFPRRSHKRMALEID
jgi:hypothetical protein